jgi:TolA-binding protein
MNRNFENLRAVARLQDDWIESSNMGAEIRQRLFSDRVAIKAPQRSRTMAWWGAGCAAVSMAAAAAWVLLPRHAGWVPLDSSLTFSMGQEAQHGSIGKWMSAAATALPLKFSDGTQIVLQPSAQARVTELHESGAHVVLERGELAAAVHHQFGTHWELQAGPFSVVVRGTRFNLGWTPESSTFALGLTEGMVDVTGPGLTGPRSVRAGQSLRVSAVAGGWKVDDGSNAVSPVANEAPTSDPNGATAEQPASSEVAAVNAAAPKVSNPAPGWQDLAAAGNYADSMAAARKSGLQRIYATGSVNELTKLAQVARFAGDAESARAALRAVRERFAGSAEAAMATFDLGRLSFDTSGRYLEAAHWFKDYLREFPHGNLAREAMGRLVESLERGGDHTGAREAASEYLLRFPNGPHAGLAHRVLNH